MPLKIENQITIYKLLLQTDKGLNISVHDNGQGIPADKLNIIGTTTVNSESGTEVH